MNVFERYEELAKVRNSALVQYMNFTNKLTDKHIVGVCEDEEDSKQQEEYYSEWAAAHENADLFSAYIIELSKFNISEVAPVLVDLISVFEGSNYSLSKASIDRGSIRSLVYVVIEESAKQQNYNNEELQQLEREGKALILSEVNSKDSFCTYNNERSLSFNYNISKFWYLKAFLDQIICFKDENKTYDIESSLVCQMKEQFVLDNIDAIEEDYLKKDQKQKMEISRLNEEIECRGKMLLKIKGLKPTE